MRENVLFRYVLPLLLILPVGFLLLYPQLLRCIRIGDSPEFQLLTGTHSVYVNQSATVSQKKQLHRHLSTARDRIRRFWGDQRGNAVLIYCPKQADYEQYCAGGEGAGCSIGTPWGKSYLVLGPDGNNANVMAHELCHEELFARLGWWHVKQQIPQWFNEGLALMVDYRFSNPSVWEQPGRLAGTDSDWKKTHVIPFPPRPMLKLTDLETTHAFFGGDNMHTMLAYRTATEEVTRWLTVVGRAGIPILTYAVATGSDFNDTYRRLERESEPRKKKR